MISEVDIRDWDKVDFQKMYAACADATLLTTPNEDPPYWETMMDFLTQVEAIRDKQLKLVQKQIPALFRKGEE